MTDPPDLLDAALRALPHGPEFRFLDRLSRLDPGRSGAGEYSVRGDESFLRGHLPGEPLLPGVLLLEATAQLAGVIAQTDPVAGPMPGLKLTALRAVKILGSAQPGQTVHLQANISGRLGRLVHAQVSAFVDGVRILSGEVTLSGSAGPADPVRNPP